MKRKHRPAAEVIASLLKSRGALSSLRLKLLVFLYDYQYSLDEGRSYTGIRYVKGIYGFLHSITAKEFDSVLKDMVKEGFVEEIESVQDDGWWKGYKLTEKGEKLAKIDISRVQVYLDMKLTKLIEKVFDLTAEKEYGVMLV